MSADGGSYVQTPFQRALAMLCLIIAGETIFCLPFHVTRFFRPTVLQVFELTNFQLGQAMTIYGITAMLAYVPGGPLADLFPARRLLASSLLLTGLGGFYFSTFPSLSGLSVLFGFWGVTTILLFWAALIRATRDWGSAEEQGRAYGLLDGGRGLLAAALVTLAIVLFQLFLPEDPGTATALQRREALRGIILAYSWVTIAASILVWCFVPEGPGRTQAQAQAPDERIKAQHIFRVLTLPTVWLQALIVVCAYVAYKGFDNFSLFAVEVYGWNEVEASQLSAASSWIRPFAALAAGMLGDRFGSSRVIFWGFLILASTQIIYAIWTPNPSLSWVLISNIVVASIALFGLRGVYFALFEEAKVPRAFTGTAVGLVSVIGYTPDIYVSLVAGWLLDRSPGVTGHQHFFLFMAIFSLIGMAATVIFQRLCRRSSHHSENLKAQTPTPTPE